MVGMYVDALAKPESVIQLLRVDHHAKTLSPPTAHHPDACHGSANGRCPKRRQYHKVIPYEMSIPGTGESHEGAWADVHIGTELTVNLWHTAPRWSRAL